MLVLIPSCIAPTLSSVATSWSPSPSAVFQLPPLLAQSAACMPAFPALFVLATSAAAQPSPSTFSILPSMSLMRISASSSIPECSPFCDPVVLLFACFATASSSRVFTFSSHRLCF